jgi:hypothetical protein
MLQLAPFTGADVVEWTAMVVREAFPRGSTAPKVAGDVRRRLEALAARGGPTGRGAGVGGYS